MPGLNLYVAIPELVSCAVASSAESSQYFADASQNLTWPGVYRRGSGDDGCGQRDHCARGDRRDCAARTRHGQRCRSRGGGGPGLRHAQERNDGQCCGQEQSAGSGAAGNGRNGEERETTDCRDHFGLRNERRASKSLLVGERSRRRANPKSNPGGARDFCNYEDAGLPKLRLTR